MLRNFVKGAASGIPASMEGFEPITIPDEEPAKTSLYTDVEESSQVSLGKPTVMNATLIPELDSVADFWGKIYQTSNDPTKKDRFQDNVNNLIGAAPKEKEIRLTVDAVVDRAFSGDLDTNPEKVKDFLYMTALHESGGGQYDEQTGGGPAVGWWQVEPETAKDILKNSGAFIGQKAEQLMGISKNDMMNMSEATFKQTLKNPVVNAIFATAKTLSGAKAHQQLAFLQ